MGQINSTFVGYGQQDSHELLQALLDGLHEDLNRIAKKDYIEDPDIGNLTHDEFAAISWEFYLKRNNSIIVDLFQAQLKNRTECQICKHESIKFDPYMYLQLPVPEKQIQIVDIICLAKIESGRNVRPVQMQVKLKKNASIADLKLETAKLIGWSEEAQKDPNFSICFEVWKMNIHKRFPNYETIGQVVKGDVICILELSNACDDFKLMGDFKNENPKDLKCLAVNFCSKRSDRLSFNFAPPLLITVPSTISLQQPQTNLNFQYNLGKLLYRIIVRELARYGSWALFRRVGSDIATPIPPSTLDGQIDPRTAWLDSDSNIWEPIPNLFKLVQKSSWGENVVLYPILDPENSANITESAEEIHSPLLNLSDDQIAPTSNSHPLPPPYSINDPQDKLKNEMISEYIFSEKNSLTMEFEQELAENLFGSNIRFSEGGNPDQLMETNFRVSFIEFLKQACPLG